MEKLINKHPVKIQLGTALAMICTIFIFGMRIQANLSAINTTIALNYQEYVLNHDTLEDDALAIEKTVIKHEERIGRLERYHSLVLKSGALTP